MIIIIIVIIMIIMVVIIQMIMTNIQIIIYRKKVSERLTLWHKRTVRIYKEKPIIFFIKG